GDTGTGSGLSGDLRYCITQINALPSGTSDTINFSSGMAGQTITLTSTLPTINAATGTLTITDAGAAGVTISGNNANFGFSTNRDLILNTISLVHSGPTGGVRSSTSNSITAINCSFLNDGGTSLNSGGGGAIGTSGLVTVTNCTFASCGVNF